MCILYSTLSVTMTFYITIPPLLPSRPPLTSVPPILSDRGNITRRENEQLSLDISDPGSHPAFPFPSDVTWRRDGVELMNMSDTRVFGYPSIFIGSVLQSDAGPYTLTATNYQLDGVTPVGTGSGSFTLNVLCEYLSQCRVCSKMFCAMCV